MSWEPEASLPTAVIQEFENKLSKEVYEQRASHYGYNSSSVMIAAKTEIHDKSKRVRTECPVIQDSQG